MSPIEARLRWIQRQYWKPRAIAAIDYALAHEPQFRTHMPQFRAALDTEIKAENAVGIPTPYRTDYVPHATEFTDYERGFEGDKAGGGEGLSFTKQRLHNTMVDAINAGANPRSINAFDLMERRIRSGQQRINMRSWVEAQRTWIDPTTQQPIVKDTIAIKRPPVMVNGKPVVTTYPTAPEGYSVQQMGFQDVAVQKGYEGTFSAMTDPSWFGKNPAMRFLTTANAGAKSWTLMLDTFHLGRISAYDAASRLGLGEVPKFSHREGLTMLDYSPQEIQKMVQSGEIPQRYAANLQYEAHLNELMIKEDTTSKASVIDYMLNGFVSCPSSETSMSFCLSNINGGPCVNCGRWSLSGGRQHFRMRESQPVLATHPRS
jgi:hypothetical protein